MNHFTGLSVALATPFTADFAVDLPGFRRVVRHTLAGGVDTLVVLGSTGEAATLLDAERDALISACLEEAGSVPVVVGTGSNATRQAAAWTRRAQELGAQGALVVTPYYNKPTPGGLVAHYQAVTEAAPGLPVIIYNVPGRTGLNLLPATLAMLWANPQLVAVKESSGNLAQIAEIARTLPAGKTLLSGDDNLALAAMAVGASGLVSVLANVLPAETKRLVDLALAGKRAEAIALHQALLPLMDALFLESNPIPTKAALALKGICGEALRLPLVPASAATKARLSDLLAAGVEVA
ncbi:MAG: 4-hydroxy-tetrahydrodipicolinate synthase [Holophaga sp.]|nr:4-hydroxy-tetrahydrodipicolinate synthase [Holophaga sp.]